MSNRLLKRLTLTPKAAAIAVFVWLAMPINSEVVAWRSACACSLSAVFLFLAGLLAHLYLRNSRPATLIFFAIAALAAVFSHEEGVLLLPLTILVAYTMGKTASVSARTL